ncbi:MAG TPA: hypothetical protein VF746_19530 [Longimicrobium sp.]|jgi:hypothetical protein
MVQAGGGNPSDGEAARDAAAMGTAGISRETGTGSAGSGLAAGGGRDLGHTAHAATTGPTTDQAEDLADAVGPSSAGFGGTGTAGSGLGAASATGVPPAGSATGASGGPSSAAAGGGSSAPGATGAQSSGGSEAGGGGGLGRA